jgi:biotin carboxyl carrier protein
MKLETSMAAPRDGVIAAILFEAGAGFGKGAVLATLAPTDDGAPS